MKLLPDLNTLTAEELEAFELSGALAVAIHKLPPVHPQELEEAVTHIHALQVSILARAAYPKAER